VAPIFLKELEPMSAFLGSEFEWHFELNARPTADFKLYKDNKEIKLNDSINITRTEVSEFSYIIKFKKSDANDIGTYKLDAKNKCGTASCSSTLNVSGGPVIVRKPNSELQVAEKKSLKAEFEVNGLPLPEVEWLVIRFI
jgi:hypothetical protein